MNRDEEVKVLWERGRRDPSEPQGEETGTVGPAARPALKEAGERTHGAMNKNRIRGDGVQGERANDREALTAKGRRRQSGDRAGKATGLTGGDLG